MEPGASTLLKVSIRFEQDIVLARQRARAIAGALGFDSQDQTRLATAVSELARNSFQYAGAGSVEFGFQQDSHPQVFEIQVCDQGPGIQNLDDILGGRYVSETGMGVGLIGSKKIMDEFRIHSDASGTRIVLRKHFTRSMRPKELRAVEATIDQLRQQTSMSAFEEIQRQNQEIMGTMEELHARQAELSDLNRELGETNRGVVALYAELDEKALSLQKANELKTSFLSNMTHEFRTPLSSIMSLTRILLDRVDGELTEEQDRQVGYIRQSAEGLLELVNDLLDLAKVDAGKVAIRRETFNVSLMLTALRGVFRPLLAQREGIDFVVEIPDALPAMSSDEGKVSQILRNIISNAIKYTVRGEISVTAYEVGDNIIFKVRDTGIGIEPQLIEHIFQDFTQIDSSLQSQFKGTGLGLPLSRRLARLLNGDVTVSSRPGNGSEFTVTLPLNFIGTTEGSLTS